MPRRHWEVGRGISLPFL